jgi:hypothetical protein
MAEEEGQRVTVERGADPARVKVTGNIRASRRTAACSATADGKPRASNCRRCRRRARDARTRRSRSRISPIGQREWLSSSASISAPPTARSRGWTTSRRSRRRASASLDVPQLVNPGEVAAARCCRRSCTCPGHGLPGGQHRAALGPAPAARRRRAGAARGAENAPTARRLGQVVAVVRRRGRTGRSCRGARRRRCRGSRRWMPRPPTCGT